jgi:hypothetical protein
VLDSISEQVKELERAIATLAAESYPETDLKQERKDLERSRCTAGTIAR